MRGGGWGGPPTPRLAPRLHFGPGGFGSLGLCKSTQGRLHPSRCRPVSSPDPHPRGSDLRKSSILPVLDHTPPNCPRNCHPDRAARPLPHPGHGREQWLRPGQGARPRPVLTPTAAAVTADCSAARAERSRLRPIGSKLRNSLDRSRELVAEAAEWLCSSRLLRRTTMFVAPGPGARGGREGSESGQRTVRLFRALNSGATSSAPATSARAPGIPPPPVPPTPPPHGGGLATSLPVGRAHGSGRPGGAPAPAPPRAGAGSGGRTPTYFSYIVPAR